MSRDYLAIARQYEADILAGVIPACKWVRLACERNRQDRARAGTPGFPFTFSDKAAVKICAFAELLPYVSGRGFSEVLGQDEDGLPIYKPLQLQPWQVWILTTLFGWMNARGLRRFRVGLVLVPRKNGKSTVGAIVSLYMLTEEGEPGAQCYSAATTRDQAKAVAEVVWEMAKRAPKLRAYYGVKLGSATSRGLSVPAMASKFAALSADANTLDGLNISCAVIDELHAHKRADVWNVIDTGTSARQQPLIFAITTAGVDIGGICHQKLAYLEKILDGVATDDTFFGINYTVDAGDDYRLPATARKANPNYGVSVEPDDIARKVNESQYSQANLNDILTKHFNVWIRSESTWLSATTWQTCARRGLTWELLRSFPCWIGIDLGEVRDYSAVVLVFKTGPDTFAVLPFIYVPAGAVDSSPIAMLSGWVRGETIIETPGNEADYERIKADVLEWIARLNVQEVDFDRRSARLMMQTMRQVLEPSMGRDRVEAFVLDIAQSIETMDPAMKMTERLVTAKKLEHDGNEAMAWMIANIVIERNQKDEMYPRKAGGKDSANKIDGPVAMFTALSRAMVGIQASTPQLFVLGGR